MILARFLEWRDAARRREFRGREYLARLYRFFLFQLFDPGLKFLYRLRLCVKTGQLSPFTNSDYRLLKEIRRHYPTPWFVRSWSKTMPLTRGLADYDDLISQVHALKSHAASQSWILPETAILAPTLDCKGFAVLVSTLLAVHRIPNELWIGLPAEGLIGHAWLIVTAEGERIAVDQLNGYGTRELLYLHDHPYAMTVRL
ncbi:MAG: hypothetical protein R3231_07340 [bacterium]|nr:hypothetical protein [bacterium]